MTFGNMMWKTALGRCIYESDSGVQVHQNARYRWLATDDDALQTLINRRRPEQPGLEYITPLVNMVLTFPGDCCLLGLGGAGIPHALFPALMNSRMVAVDNSQEVITIARQYFKTDRVTNLTIVHENAERFVQSTTQPYQHVMVDLYHSNNYPVECNTDAFFIHCKALLNSTGILTVNIINLQKQHELFRRIRQQFNQCTLVVPVKNCSNTLVFAFKMEKSESFLEKIQQIKCLHSLVWDKTWGCMGHCSERNFLVKQWLKWRRFF